ncbi:Protein spt10 [Coniosporium apollinis]|uniref:Protein spt10 n=1 Tax=Coniosporium apollinis TaxID=61459 RepID=A0ABQ9NWH9_9PEZI|nr:Protein spt10 [Coniosporium apollinis]
MPAMLDDPAGPAIYRVSGEPPYPTPNSPLPPEIVPRTVTLRDRVTTATLMPFSAVNQVPVSLLSYLCDQLNREIEKGDTYPMVNPMPLESFGPYWFQNFGAVMLLGDLHDTSDVWKMESEGRDWEKDCLGSFYIKPNYPGRSSHVCNGGFLVTDAARNRGVGRLMGEGYLEWAPKLGYTYSVFNLVYETNVASCRIWDALGFKRIGRVKDCGNLRSYPDQLVDAIIYGRDLGTENDDYLSEERFDKIRFYLKHSKYPSGADRAEKSRLRSAATHYKLIPATGDEPEKLMLKGKEVIAEPQKQYEIARNVHIQQHGGINKTTATIAEKYHWVRIKETVSQVIRDCPDCKEMAKTPSGRSEGSTFPRRSNGSPENQEDVREANQPIGMVAEESSGVRAPSPSRISPSSNMQMHHEPTQHQAMPMASMHGFPDYSMPVDPRIMDGMNSGFSSYGPSTHQQLASFPQHGEHADQTAPAQSHGLSGAFAGAQHPQIQANAAHQFDGSTSYMMPQSFAPQQFGPHNQTLQPEYKDGPSASDVTSSVNMGQQAVLQYHSAEADDLARHLMNAGYGGKAGQGEYGGASGYGGAG